eukprot:TRINITY_DN2274_c0_g2_i6.p1 TRINITY_DN2274_c0_g2~~TRINITY_DN2274_c0_g2_i6.p1  ORF type:complete len:519 (-),score=112.44 TRINITY_DN2274_c0_g2_i6:169-1725(-)
MPLPGVAIPPLPSTNNPLQHRPKSQRERARCMSLALQTMHPLPTKSPPPHAQRQSNPLPLLPPKRTRNPKRKRRKRKKRKKRRNHHHHRHHHHRHRQRERVQSLPHHHQLQRQTQTPQRLHQRTRAEVLFSVQSPVSKVVSKRQKPMIDLNQRFNQTQSNPTRTLKIKSHSHNQITATKMSSKPIGMLELRKAKTAKGRRILKNREPQLIETLKKCLVIKGPKSSETVNQFLMEMKLLKTDVVYFSQKHQIRPFDDMTSMEFHSQKNDCGLFIYGSNTKKRPDNIIMGRFFNHQMLDMMEFGLKDFASLKDLKTKKCKLGSKPCMVFVGEEFETNEEFALAKNLLLDMFRGRVVDSVDLVGIDYVYVVTAMDGKIHFRTYTITFKKSGGRVPKAELEVMGPCFDLVPRRVYQAADSLQKEARKIPKSLMKKKKKNITTNVFGEQIGRIHVQQQDLKTMQLKKMKAYSDRKRKKSVKDSEAAANDDGDNDDDEELQSSSSSSKNKNGSTKQPSKKRARK